MFLEYCDGGDLKSYLEKKNNKILSELEAVTIFRQIIAGYKYLFDKHIIHRDIKPANILIKNGIIKIADFGFARCLEQSDMEIAK